MSDSGEKWLKWSEPETGIKSPDWSHFQPIKRKLNSEDLKDGLLERSMSDTTKDGEPGDGEELTEDTGKEYVEDSCGGEDAEMFTEEDIITTDTTTGLEPGDTSMSTTEDLNKFNKNNFIIILLLLISFKKWKIFLSYFFYFEFNFFLNYIVILFDIIVLFLMFFYYLLFVLVNISFWGLICAFRVLHLRQLIEELLI